MSAAAHLAALLARYDAIALRPPSAVRRPVAPDAWAALQAWCMAGAGPGGTPWWRPGAAPALQQRYAVAQWSDDPAVVQAWAAELDGTTRLQACAGPVGRLALRLRTKLDDACWWRRRRPADPWDAGELIDSPAAAQQLQQHFVPRRASLLVAGPMDAQRLADCLAALQRRSASFRHPVRVLLLADAPVPAGLAVARITPSPTTAA